MKLLKVQISSGFRSLPPGFKLEFHKSGLEDTQIEPICMVGLNGSGKSNTLELISELFFYLERYANASDEDDLHELEQEEEERFSSGANAMGLALEMEYILNREAFHIARQTHRDSLSAYLNGISTPHIRIIKPGFKRPQFLYAEQGSSDEKFEPLIQELWKQVMPLRIIGYSSGQNELISNPYIKMDQHYFDSFEKRLRAEAKGKFQEKLDINRMFFMDYDSNKLTVLANYLIPNEKTDALKNLNKALKIDRLIQFSITIKLNAYNNEPIKLPAEVSRVIDDLKECATTWQDAKTGVKMRGEKAREIYMHFWVNEATRTAFQRRFRDAFKLYKDLYNLRLLNIYTLPTSIRKMVREAGAGTNLSALIPRPEESKIVFSIEDIAFKKKNTEEKVFYRQLSDGEHQLLHVLGLVVLMSEPGTLFLLDEPETHFNPEWRSKFVTFLNDCTTERVEKGRLKRRANEQEFLLTTHSPFVISDCKRHNVFVFSRLPGKREVKYRHPKEETFGASIINILDDCFDHSSLVAHMSAEKIRQAAKKKTIKGLDQSLSEFGDSPLRNRLILMKLNQLLFEQENQEKA